MAWTSFPTLTDGQVLTGAHMQIVRDNFAETAPAKASTTGRIFVATGANVIAERAISSATVTTAETTGSASYTNLTTTGPAVTVTTGANAIAFINAQVFHNTNGASATFGVAVTGLSSIAAADAQAGLWQAATAASAGGRFGVIVHFAGTLTAGSNTFTMQYKTSTATATFQNRSITVIAL